MYIRCYNIYSYGCMGSQYTIVKHVNTATEFLDNYKNCVIVRKDKSTNDYVLTIKNPYTQDIRYRITNVIVPSGLWYNYSIGDTIGKKKQIYFNQ